MIPITTDTNSMNAQDLESEIKKTDVFELSIKDVKES